MKVVINTDCGGFELSDYAKELLLSKGYDLNWDLYENRAHPALIECIEEIGEKAAGMYSKLTIVDIPDNSYFIDCCNGFESVSYPSQSWWIKPNTSLLLNNKTKQNTIKL